MALAVAVAFLDALGEADAVALGNLGACLNELGRKEDAVALLEKAAELTPDDAIVRFHLAAARGETPATQPKEMLAALFDGYAGGWSLISVITSLPPTVLPLDGPANVPSGGDQTVNLA